MEDVLCYEEIDSARPSVSIYFRSHPSHTTVYFNTMEERNQFLKFLDKEFYVRKLEISPATLTAELKIIEP